jgi:threonine dehydratase
MLHMLKRAVFTAAASKHTHTVRTARLQQCHASALIVCTNRLKTTTNVCFDTYDTNLDIYRSLYPQKREFHSMKLPSQCLKLHSSTLSPQPSSSSSFRWDQDDFQTHTTVTKCTGTSDSIYETDSFNISTCVATYPFKFQHMKLYCRPLKQHQHQHQHQRRCLSVQSTTGVEINDDADANVGDVAPLDAGTCSYSDIVSAYSRVSGVVKKSPLDLSPHISSMCDANVFLKKEHVSITGSYKERGALNKILQLTDEEKSRGVVCSSAGNHAQAVSYHATRLGINAVIVMPENTPTVKVEATRRFGGQVVLHGMSFQEAFDKATDIAVADDRVFVHAFNDAAIVAGQGTVAMEMLEQNPYLDAVVVPVGGGGLIAGMSRVLKHVNPRIKVYGVEATAMPGMFRSFKSGTLSSVPRNPTMADGMAVENVGQIPYALVREFVDDIVLVDEDEIASSVLTLLEHEKTVVEGSGACGLAAILSKKVDIKGQTVGIVLSGGNIDMSLLGRIIEKGLVKKGRLARIAVTIPDVPGALATITSTVGQLRANIREIEHERAFLIDHVGFTQPVFTVETRGHDHVQEIVQHLRDQGFTRVALNPVSDISRVEQQHNN